MSQVLLVLSELILKSLLTSSQSVEKEVIITQEPAADPEYEGSEAK